MNKNNIKNINPIIFIKKVNDKHKIIPLKNTSSKVIITLHIYNEEQRYLNSKLKYLLNTLYPKKKNFFFKGIKKHTNLSLAYNKSKFSFIKENLSLISYLDNLYSSICRRTDIEEYLFNPITLENFEEYKKLHEDIKFFLSIKTLEDYRNLKKAYEYILFYSFYEKNIQELSYYKLLLNLNKSKFENNFLSKLTGLMINLYNKAIEFNIINLKAMNLNSDIFTKAISMKLKDRNNKLMRVLKAALFMVKLPIFFRIKENYKKLVLRELLINRVNNLYNKSIISKCNDYTLNKLLYNLFTKTSSIKINNKLSLNTSKKKNNFNKEIEKTILNTLKYKNIYGARLEAKGRLTKRFTASRSLFKLK